MRKLLMLDVDGVFAVKSLILPGKKEPEGMAEREPDLCSFPVPMLSVPGNFNVLASPSIVSRMQSVTQKVDTVWFTSWFGETRSLNQVLGFAMDFLGDDSLLKDDSWWKVEFLQEHFIDREIIWVDDDFNTFPEAGEWASTQHGRVHLVPTKATVGLTSNTVDFIEELLS